MSVADVDAGAEAVAVDAVEQTNHPRGGLTTSAGGDGMFIDPSGEYIKLFVDPRVKSARAIIKAAEAESADISADHEERETQLLILHPSSMALFDSYCHPNWYPPKRRREYHESVQEGIEIEGQELWKGKVILKESWLDRCLNAGRFLGEQDDWGGCRVGGPPVPKLGIAKEQPVDLVIVELPHNPTGDDPALEGQQTGGTNQAGEDINMENDDGPALQSLQSIAPSPPSPETKPVMDELGDIVNTQPVQGEASEVRQERLESPEESLASTQQARKKRKRRNSMEMLDIDMLDSRASSRLGSHSAEPSASTSQLPSAGPPDDGNVFQDLSIFLDLSTKDRSGLLKEIKAAGGIIAVDYPDATHVLVYKYWSNKFKWDSLVASHAPQGVWFVNHEWAKASLRDKRRAPELMYCVPNAEQAVRSTTTVKVPQRPVVDLAVGIAATRPKPSESAKKGEYEMSVERLDEILQQEYDAMLVNERGRKQMLKGLHEKYPGYTSVKWGVIYREWRTRTGQFSHLPPFARRSTLQALEERPLRVKVEPSRPEVTVPLLVTRSSETLAAAKSSDTVGSRPYGRGNAARMSVQALAEAISEAHDLDEGIFSTVPELAGPLCIKHPVYTYTTWCGFIDEWRGGRGRFRPYGTRWNGLTLDDDQAISGDFDMGLAAQEPEHNELHESDGAMSERHEEEIEEARETSTGATTGARTEIQIIRGPYTAEEELAMSQFARAMLDRDGFLRNRHWNEFAEVYPYRNPGTWAEHWRRYRGRIESIEDPDLPSHDISAIEPTTPAEPSEVQPPTTTVVEPSMKTPRKSEPVASTKRKAEPAPNAEASSSTDKGFKSASSTISRAEPAKNAEASSSSSKPKSSNEPENLDKQHYDILAHYVVNNFPDCSPRRSADFKALGQSHPRFSARSWRNVWKRDQDHPMLKSSLEHYRQILSAKSGGGSSGGGKRQARNRYTEEEEQKMVEFIYQSIPSDRPATFSDWVIFQKKNRGRTAASWAEHYRRYKSWIDDLVDEKRAASFAIEMTSWSRPPKRRSAIAAETVELESDEEEEEEVEEIVPLQSSRRSTRRRGEVVIISDDGDDD